jgi:uncharacterized protein (DUF58 family)
MMRLLKNTFLTNRFYVVMGVVIFLMMFSYAFPWLAAISKTGLVLLSVVCIIDVTILLSMEARLRAERMVPGVLSLGDENVIEIRVQNNSASLNLTLEVVDEIPEQFQKRDLVIPVALKPGEQKTVKYPLRPVTRGNYVFGDLHVFLTTPLWFVKRKTTFPQRTSIPVYPSIVQMKRYELKTFDRKASEFGVKKVRRIGHSYEFEHIKHYVPGDDYRSINWKVTSRRAQLMVNQYEDEKSQQVYCIIDKSRVMHMPFDGLSLFDYAVNASLVISNIVLGKQDKAGLISFAEAPKSIVRAERSKTQLRKIMEALYSEKEGTVEANYESLYMTIRKVVTGRSLLFLYTNFESTYALHRALPHLRKLNKQHLLVVVFFENTELFKQESSDRQTLEDVYTKITAEQYALSKVQIANELRQVGISSILTKPEELTVNSINKYLELKSRGMI